MHIKDKINLDLIIVCFGFNDVNDTKAKYLSSLEEIFEKCKASGAETIFMTPNMLNTYVARDTATHLMSYAAKTAQFQTEGIMDDNINCAKKLADNMGIKVCDCYEKQKKLSESEDVTMLLANRINHPTKEMHKLFAESLFEIIFSEVSEVIADESKSGTMYRE